MVDARLHPADVVAHDEQDVGLLCCCAAAGMLVAITAASSANRPSQQVLADIFRFII